MSQDYSDDVFGSTQQVQANMQQIEDNFAALKSAFSGATTPADTVAGMVWLDTTANILKIRNLDNNAWLSVWDMTNNKPIIANLSAEITLAMMAAACSDAAAGTPSLRSIGTTATKACAGNDARLSDTRTPPDLGVTEAKLAASAVAQSKLKTSTGEVSYSYVSSEDYYANLTLPGGEYGFWPQVKVGSGTFNQVGLAFAYSNTSYSSNIGIVMQAAGTGYAKQRYVTSSGESVWLFFLRDKATKKVKSSWLSTDHPCFGNGGDPEAMPHPFVGVKDDEEVVRVIISKDDLDRIQRKNGSLLQAINEDYAIDDKVTPEWEDVAVTVGLPEGYDWQMAKRGDSVTPIKKTIRKPEGIKTARLKRK